MLMGQITGAAYMSNWAKNCINCETSLYWMANADNQRLMPRAVITISRMRIGKNTIWKVGIMPYANNIINRMTKAIRKSNSFESIGVSGMIMRGK